jgi:hypothetical protein
MRARSPALVVPVHVRAPDRPTYARVVRGRGRPGDTIGSALLSEGQAQLYAWCRERIRRRRATFTVREAGAELRMSPGRVSHNLRRLRSCDLIAMPRVRGRWQRTRIWIPRQAAVLASRRRRASLFSTGKDSLSTSFGGFLSREGLARAWAATGRRARAAPPPGRRSAAAGHGPPPGGKDPRLGPPRKLYDRCPGCGSRRPLSVWRSSLSARRLEGRWRGWCRRCNREVIADVSIELPWTEPARPRPSPPTLSTDPEVRARRRAIAARMAAAGELPDELRPYLVDEPLRDSNVAPAGDDVDLSTRDSQGSG